MGKGKVTIKKICTLTNTYALPLTIHTATDCEKKGVSGQNHPGPEPTECTLVGIYACPFPAFHYNRYIHSATYVGRRNYSR